MAGDAALLVLCLARRELVEERPGWGSRNGVLDLEPLADEQAGVLVEEVAAKALDEETRTEIVRIAGGNSAFLEQLLAFLEEAGPSALGSVPPTVEALLAGRLEHLDPAERALTERAAVAAETSPWRTRAIPAGGDRRTRLAVNGTPSAAAWYVRCVAATTTRTASITSSSVRDVAYAGTTKEARAELHERFGTWLEQRDSRGRDRRPPSGASSAATSSTPAIRLSSASRSAQVTCWLRPGSAGGSERMPGRLANLLGRAASLLLTGEPKRAEILCETSG